MHKDLLGWLPRTGWASSPPWSPKSQPQPGAQGWGRTNLLTAPPGLQAPRLGLPAGTSLLELRWETGGQRTGGVARDRPWSVQREHPQDGLRGGLSALLPPVGRPPQTARLRSPEETGLVWHGERGRQRVHSLPGRPQSTTGQVAKRETPGPRT